MQLSPERSLAGKQLSMRRTSSPLLKLPVPIPPDRGLQISPGASWTCARIVSAAVFAPDVTSRLELDRCEEIAEVERAETRLVCTECLWW